MMKIHTRIRTTSHTVSGRVRLLALAVSLVAMAFGAAPAAADGNVPQPPPQPLTAAEMVRLGIKSEVAKTYAEFKLAGGTPAQFAPQLAELEYRLNGGKPLLGGVTSPTSQNSSAAPASASEQANIWPTFATQEYGWWCGPADAWMTLNYKYPSAPSFDGDALNQTGVADIQWLGTSYPAGTGYGANWTTTLNAWMDGDPAGWYLRENSPTATLIGEHVSFDVDASWASVLDVQMNSSRGYLTGFTAAEGDANGNIWHYVTATGYSGYGSVIGYLDPSPLGANGYSYANATQFATLMSGYGMIW
jgi:hypothetical protein